MLFFEALKLGYLIHLHPLDNAHAEHTRKANKEILIRHFYDLHQLDNAHAERTTKKRHPEVPNVSFFILLSAPEACLYRSRLPTKTFVMSHA